MNLHENLGEDVFTADTDDIDVSAPRYTTDYEIERNKPMPNLIHGVIQKQIILLLGPKFNDQFLLASEVSLASTPPSTPDLCIFPKRKLDIRTMTAKEQTVPITTIEIISPSQSINELMHKAWDTYFPMGVQSAWIVIPEFKAIQVVLPNDEKHYFDAGLLTDPATGITIEIEKVFEDLL